jgi:iron uptake system component EfeO
MSRRAAPTAALALATAALTTLTACAGGAQPADVTAISVSNGGCGGDWHLPDPGWHTFQIYNAAAESGDVDLIDPANGAIYAEVEAVGPGTSAPMRLDVGSGKYAFRCLLEDFDAITGPTETVSGEAKGSPAIAPVTNNDLYGPARQYHAYVTAGLATLVTQADALAKDVRAGNLAKARTDWLPAHLTYERLGAAYDAFGSFDDEIDGRPDGLAGGVTSSRWTGFYRLEYGLWHGQSAHELTPVATALDSNVKGLQKSWPSTEIDLLDIGLRTHEILENALQFQLSGHDDYGSGTTLATTEANITGTQELLTVLHPLLAVRYAQLPAVTTWLDRLQSLISTDSYHNGTWNSPTSLPLTSRQEIVAACSQALEELAPIATVTEPRRT